MKESERKALEWAESFRKARKILINPIGKPLAGEAWILASVNGRYEIQRRDEVCADSYSDTDALILVAQCVAQGDKIALEALKLVNFQRRGV